MKNHLKRKLHKTDTSEDSAVVESDETCHTNRPSEDSLVEESDETCHTKETQLSEDSAVEETGEMKVTQIQVPRILSWVGSA